MELTVQPQLVFARSTVFGTLGLLFQLVPLLVDPPLRPVHVSFVLLPLMVVLTVLDRLPKANHVTNLIVLLTAVGARGVPIQTAPILVAVTVPKYGLCKLCLPELLVMVTVRKRFNVPLV